MADRLKGKVAVVTGSGRGLGKCHALALAAEGAKLVINDLGGAVDGTGAAKGPADEVVEEIKKMGGEAVANYDSVATPEAGEKIVQTAVDAFGRIDILVNNAGVLRDRMVFNMTEEEWDTAMKVHLYGHFNCAKPACVLFRQQRSGRIINTSSIAGLGNMGQANYSAAKEGIVGLTRTVAIDMGRYGVTCNAIRPMAGTRLTLTPELFEAWKKRGMTEDQIKAMWPAPDDISPMVVFLCCDEAANINGRTFDVMGGNIGLYSEPYNWRSIYKKGIWTVDELVDLIPKSLSRGLQNPSPPAPPKE
ncbi:MAG: SDR family oxidoreductase [Chloroflexota bacterium]|nr:SDR family oxidoreductase [Chloroflexota bacterium]